MLKWEKSGSIIHGNGEVTIVYEAEGSMFRIESRKRNIPHNKCSGTWSHTTFYVVGPGGYEKEYWRLRDAKKAAEGRRR